MKKKIRLAGAIWTAACLFCCGCGESGERIPLEQALARQEPRREAGQEATREAGQEAGQEARQEAAQEAGWGSGEQSVSERKRDTVWVHICGEVQAPGVYELEAGSRICDALLAAGGFTEAADTEFYNLAKLLEDGMQIAVPNRETAREQARENGGETDGRININTATAEMLCTLPGIGESRARDIIAYREKHGKFSSPEQIMEVSGIKQAVYDKIRDLITV